VLLPNVGKACGAIIIIRIKNHIFIQKSFNKYQYTRSSLDFKYSQYWESTKAFQQAIDFCKQLRIEIRRRQEAEEENEALKRRIELLEEALFESQEKLNKTLVFLNTTS